MRALQEEVPSLAFLWWVAYFRVLDQEDGSPVRELAAARAPMGAAGGPPGETPEEALTRRIMARRMTPEAMLGEARAYARAMEAAGR